MASMSGITVDEGVVEWYAGDLKIRKSNAYAILVISPVEGNPKQETVKIEELGDPLPKDCSQEENRDRFEKLKETKLSSDKPCYIIYDFRFKSVDGRPVDKLALITWISDLCPVKKKMKYSSTKEVLPKKLPGLKSIQANDMGDLDYAAVLEFLQKSK